MKPWFFNDREKDGEKAIARYLIWEFIHSFDSIAEEIAYMDALKYAFNGSNSFLLYQTPQKDWRHQKNRLDKNHLRNVKMQRNRLRQKPTPADCRPLADCREKSLEILIQILEGEDEMSWDEQLAQRHALLEAQAMARTERDQLHKFHKAAIIAERKNGPNRLPRKWRF